MDWLGVITDLWIAGMLTIQSVILYKLLPEIKRVSSNSDVLGLLGGKKK